MSAPPKARPPQIGDKVFVRPIRNRSLMETLVRTITRVTPATIVAEEYSFNKVSLRNQNDEFVLEFATEDRLKEHRLFHLVNCLRKASPDDWKRTFTEEQLAHLVELLNQ